MYYHTLLHGSIPAVMCGQRVVLMLIKLQNKQFETSIENNSLTKFLNTNKRKTKKKNLKTNPLIIFVGKNYVEDFMDNYKKCLVTLAILYSFWSSEYFYSTTKDRSQGERNHKRTKSGVPPSTGPKSATKPGHRPTGDQSKRQGTKEIMSPCAKPVKTTLRQRNSGHKSHNSRDAKRQARRSKSPSNANN